MKNAIIFLSMIISFSLPITVNAQPNQSPAPAAKPSKAPVDEATLKNFVNAYKKVAKIQSDYNKKVKGMQDQQKIQNLQQATYVKMSSAVTSSGLSLEEYKQVAQKIQQDPTLQKKVEGML